MQERRFRELFQALPVEIQKLAAALTDHEFFKTRKMEPLPHRVDPRAGILDPPVRKGG
jgi:hypothetical protein